MLIRLGLNNHNQNLLPNMAKKKTMAWAASLRSIRKATPMMQITVNQTYINQHTAVKTTSLERSSFRVLNGIAPLIRPETIRWAYMISPRIISSLRIVTSLIHQSSPPPGNRHIRLKANRLIYNLEQQVIQIIWELANKPRNLMDSMQILRNRPTHQMRRTIVIMRATPNQENMKTAYSTNKTNKRNNSSTTTQVSPSLHQTTRTPIRARTNKPIIWARNMASSPRNRAGAIHCQTMTERPIRAIIMAIMESVVLIIRTSDNPIQIGAPKIRELLITEQTQIIIWEQAIIH